MSLFVQENGSQTKPTLVFLHGAGLSSWMWEKQVQYFAPHYHCLAIDLPEQGKSSAVKPFSIKSSADMIADVIRHRATDGKAHVIGLSLGAQVLVQLLAEHSDVLHTAIINSALVQAMPFSLAVTRFLAPIILPMTHWRWYARIQAKALGIPDEQFELYFQDSQTLALPSPPLSSVFIRIMSENMNFQIPPRLHSQTVPTLLLYGAREAGIMKNSAKGLQKLLPHAEMQIVPGATHGFSLPMPDTFNAIVDDFLTRHSRYVA